MPTTHCAPEMVVAKAVRISGKMAFTPLASKEVRNAPKATASKTRLADFPGAESLSLTEIKFCTDYSRSIRYRGVTGRIQVARFGRALSSMIDAVRLLR